MVRIIAISEKTLEAQPEKYACFRDCVGPLR